MELLFIIGYFFNFCAWLVVKLIESIAYVITFIVTLYRHIYCKDE